MKIFFTKYMQHVLIKVTASEPFLRNIFSMSHSSAFQ